ncbi:xaa-Pro aminopeptidase 1-like isoform X2 [Acanthaster planci]|nr:xaa-Pro aminopeptidase 1-like isoform X2 [Acanthaster planci]XP_022096570.1 xaa-Pro aminopeptidase 1-like isoform X2 [Acanthaster planci]
MTAKNTTALLQKLRSLMKAKQYIGAEPIQAYIIPSGDAHQSEYLAACDCRRAFISGFTGSFGTAIVTNDIAALWTDGRYFLQAAQQMDSNWTLMKHGLKTTPTQEDWLVKNLPKGARVGVDPFLFAHDQWKKFSVTLSQEGLSLVPTVVNLVDLVWGDERPSPPFDQVTVLETKYAGVTWPEKIKRMQEAMTTKDAQYLVLTALDEIAWLFNLRGSDIQYNPVFFAYAVVSVDTVYLFIDEQKLTKDVRDHLMHNGLKVDIQEYDAIQQFLADLYQEGSGTGKTWISPKSSNALVSCIPKSQCVLQGTPVLTSKAVKNEVEIRGMKNAHIRDAVALCEYFQWLEKEVPKGHLTEISASDQLEQLRRQQEDYISLSFATISSIGAHGAIIHYQASPETDAPLSTQEIYLCDSGGQFKDGTTDVTRAMHLGTPTPYQKECFTRVLKGVISVATAVFPCGTTGSMIDSFARRSLWEAGLDYLHGTGHGVGAFLNVHEGPQQISCKVTAFDAALEAGVFMSDEPGYYEDGEFGIRIENIVLIKPVETKYNFRNTGFLTFETVTLVPIQTKMIEPSLLSEAEISWLNDYHAKCRDIVGAELERQGRLDALAWLHRETQPLG